MSNDDKKDNGTAKETDARQPENSVSTDRGEPSSPTGEDEQSKQLAAKEQELEKAREEANKNHDLYLRALAETENLRKRTQREREEYIKFSSLPLIKKLLGAMDDFRRAVKAGQDSQDYDALYKGVKLITGQLEQILKAEGVEVIECTGQPFDPELHQPLIVEPSEEFEENTVIEELQKGYKMHGRVIRPSLVKVSGDR